QAEDGIRDGHVTGVQTCALPISSSTTRSAAPHCVQRRRSRRATHLCPVYRDGARQTGSRAGESGHATFVAGLVETRHLCDSAGKIGRASCRERVEVMEVAVSVGK